MSKGPDQLAEPSRESPRERAGRLLAAARQAGDRRAEVAALTDLGIIFQKEGDPRRAAMILDGALTLVRPLEDPSRESDVLSNLGLAVLALGDPRRARLYLEQALATSRGAGDRFAEKLALENLGLADWNLQDLPRSIASFDQARALAHALGDRDHEARMLWFLSIPLAELGHRDQAIANAQQAVTLFRAVGHPQAESYAEFLDKYQRGLPGGPNPGALAMEPQVSGPGLLRMALSAAKAAAQFLGSGLKTVPPGTQRQRLQICGGCVHHTGLRCRLCGCFTAAKSQLPYEECPIGLWPN